MSRVNDRSRAHLAPGRRRDGEADGHDELAGHLGPLVEAQAALAPTLIQSSTSPTSAGADDREHDEDRRPW